VSSRTDYAKRISSHLAAALVTFALLQIFIIAKMGGSLVLHLGIIVAIGGFAMAARGLEHRWGLLDQGGLPTVGLALRFRRDLIQLWSASIAGALLWVPVAIIYRALFG
jgi:hypothetical protein